VDNWWMAV